MSLNHTSIYSELTEEHFKAIGKLVIEWSNIDFLLGVLLTRMLITPEFLGRTYTDNMSIAKIQDAITNAVNIHRCRYGCKIISEGKLAEIMQINNRIIKVRLLRNKLAHFCWMRSGDENIFGTGFSGKLLKRHNLDQDCVTLSMADLEKVYREAYEIVDSLTKLIERVPELEENKDLLKKLKL